MTTGRIRIADIVARTGLSRSTVDRVLNGRDGVQAKTRDRVKAALEELGYSKSTLDFLSQHRRKSVAVLLPEGNNPFFAELLRGFQGAAADLAHFGCALSYRFFDPYAPEDLSRSLAAVDPDVDAVITLGLDDPEVNRRIAALKDRGASVVTVVSDAPNSPRDRYVGQDNFAAGRTAGRLMAGLLLPEAGTVAIILGHLGFRHLLDRQSGFQQVMAQCAPGQRIVHTPPYGGQEEGRRILDELFATTQDLRGIYIAGGGQPIVIDALSDRAGDLVVIGHELNDISRDALMRDVYTALICHDVQELGQKAISAALDLEGTAATGCTISIFLKDNLPLAF